MKERLTTVLPCNDLDATEAFFARLGFRRDFAHGDDFRSLVRDACGTDLHLTRAVPGWLVPAKNPFGFYLHVADVDALAVTFAGEMIESGKAPEHKPWGMYEFSLNAPDDTLVRIGWPSSLTPPGSSPHR